MYPRLTNRVLSGNSRLTYMDPNLIDVIPWSYHHELYGEAEDHLNDFRTDIDLLSATSDEHKMSFTSRHSQIIKMLPVKMQNVLYLYFQKRMLQKKLAEKTGISQGAISHSLHEAQGIIKDFRRLPRLFFRPEKLREELKKAGLVEIQVNFFIAFLEYHHVSKAAAFVKMSQPWGSLELKKYEKIFTGQLLKILKVAKSHFGTLYACPDAKASH